MIRSGADESGDRERRRFFGLRPVNFALLGAGVVAIVVGYVLLDRGSTVAAPLLLVLGYAGLVPAGLLLGFRRSRSESDGGE
ncbi:MAG: hypothetical protein R3266_13615 [Gemmatimonadota bacterium]|nr:hypothetical protein [Gemmatimonadota bacterium]